MANTVQTGLLPLPTSNRPVQLITSRNSPLETFTNNVSVCTLWLNTVTEELYYLASLSGGVATWTLLGDASGNIEAIITDDEVVVVPVEGNIYISGGSGINTTGDSNIVTVSLDDIVPITWTTDDGDAVATSYGMNIVGGANVTTMATGDTITISASTSGGNVTFDTPAGSATSSGGTVNFAAGSGISYTGTSGSTVTISSTGGGVAASSFSAALLTDVTYNPPVNTNTLYYLGMLQAVTTISNIGGAFYPGDGVNAPATYTAPATGVYTFSMAAKWFVPPIGSTPQLNGCTRIGFVINASVSYYFDGTLNAHWSQGGPSDAANTSGSLTSTFPLNEGDVVTFLTFTSRNINSTSPFTILGAASGVVPTTYLTWVNGFRVS